MKQYTGLIYECKQLSEGLRSLASLVSHMVYNRVVEASTQLGYIITVKHVIMHPLKL